MKIGIAARLFMKQGGVGISGIFSIRLKIRIRENHYIVYLPEKSYNNFVLPTQRWEKRISQKPIGTHCGNNVFMPLSFSKASWPSHVPYFNITDCLPEKFIVDNPWPDDSPFYNRKGNDTAVFFLYYTLVGISAAFKIWTKKASAIIVPSKTNEQEILDHFHCTGKEHSGNVWRSR